MLSIPQSVNNQPKFAEEYCPPKFAKSSRLSSISVGKSAPLSLAIISSLR